MDIIETPGQPSPLGVTQNNNIINFAIFSKNAKMVTLAFFDPNTKQEIRKISLDAKKNKTGNIWHIAITNLSLPILYAYFIDGSKNAPHYFHKNKLVLDPYAHTIDSSIDWEQKFSHLPMGIIYDEKPFDWQNTSFPKIPMKDLIIYEMHVRGFTQHPSSQVQHRGKFSGIIEKIPYLLDLGVNAIELMPVFEFDETRNNRMIPHSSKKLCNFWGYSTVNFFSPMNRYASSSHFGAAKEEFQMMVRELHKHNIEVILDVVFNHVGESMHHNDYLSFLGADRQTYYILHNNHDTNFSGCGNTMKLTHPVMQQFVLDCLHYWVTEMRVDGFRFDLATIMNREMHGELLHQSSLIKQLSLDPILADKKLIAEPWDAAGGYQLGNFYPKKKRWSEWNDQFRNNTRKFIKGDDYTKNVFADHITGSSRIFSSRSPQASLNFITSHDGFTLHDLVSYNQKHNEINGEQNRDGNNYTISWNCGSEGDSKDLDILKLRQRQRKNFFIALLTAHGIPMLLMGDEYGHSKKGNNNSWCHDSDMNYFLWDQLENNKTFYLFVKNLISLRKKYPHFSKEHFLTEADIQWHGLKPFDPNWSDSKPLLGFTLTEKNSDNFYIFFNPTHEAHTLDLPLPSEGKNWFLLVNSYADSPEDFYFEDNAPRIETDQYLIQEYTAIILKEG